ncbi:MAG: metal ABC transporter permease [Pseudomonadota bacterium]
MNWLTEPFAYEFMQQAMLISALIAAAAGALSCFLVLKGWSLMGDAIAHAVLPGIVLAYMTGLPLILGAFAAGMFCAGAVGFLTENSRVKPDTVMGVVFAGMFGLGVVLYTWIQPGVHLDHILFGDVLGVTWGDIIQTGVISGAALTVLLTRRKDFLALAFDPQHARAVGLPAKWLEIALLAVIAMVVVGALKAAGLILAIALLIAPGAIAYLITKRFEHMLFASIFLAVFSAVAGVWASFWLGSAPAPTIVVVLTALFIAAFLFAPRQGILMQRV